jgi:hypothetical protein
VNKEVLDLFIEKCIEEIKKLDEYQEVEKYL